MKSVFLFQQGNIFNPAFFYSGWRVGLHCELISPQGPKLVPSFLNPYLLRQDSFFYPTSVPTRAGIQKTIPPIYPFLTFSFWWSSNSLILCFLWCRWEWTWHQIYCSAWCFVCLMAPENLWKAIEQNIFFKTFKIQGWALEVRVLVATNDYRREQSRGSRDNVTSSLEPWKTGQESCI